MKFVKAFVLAYLSILLTPATLANTTPAEHCQLYANQALCHGLIYQKDDLNLRAVEAAERSAKAATKDAYTDRCIFWTSAIAAVAAAFAAGFTFKSARDNEKYNKIQTKAYLDITDAKIYNIDTPKKTYIEFNIYNGGNTAAQRITLLTMWRYSVMYDNKRKIIVGGSHDNLEEKTAKCAYKSIYQKDKIKKNISLYDELYEYIPDYKIQYVIISFNLEYYDIYNKKYSNTWLKTFDIDNSVDNSADLIPYRRG